MRVTCIVRDSIVPVMFDAWCECVECADIKSSEPWPVNNVTMQFPIIGYCSEILLLLMLIYYS
jgi:hypothetical protein